MADCPIAFTASIAFPPIWGVGHRLGRERNSKSVGGSSVYTSIAAPAMVCFCKAILTDFTRFAEVFWEKVLEKV